MRSFDEELEAEVEKLVDPGDERRRQVAVRDLHASAGLGVVWRVGGVVMAIATVFVLLAVVGLLLGVDALGSACRVLGICG